MTWLMAAGSRLMLARSVAKGSSWGANAARSSTNLRVAGRIAAVWVLLGKTKYPAQFWQAFRGKATQTNIPFDLTIDILPEILKNPDRHLQEITSSGRSNIRGFETITGTSQAIQNAITDSLE